MTSGMSQSTRRGPCRYVAVQPAFAQAPATGSNTSEWTPQNVIALIAAIGGLITGIIGALRGTGAQSKSDANEQRLNAVATRLDAHGQQITDIAKNMVPPTMLPQMRPPQQTG